MEHSSLAISLTSLKGLEIAELKEEDIAYGLKHRLYVYH